MGASVRLLEAETPVEVLVGNALAKGARRLRRAVLMVEKGEDDAIHQVRVSCRRLRSNLKLFKGFLAGEWPADLRSELSALANACGEARDLEVIADLVKETANSEDRPEHVEQIVQTLTAGLELAAARSAEVVASERTTSLIRALETAAAAPGLKRKAAKPCGEVLPDLLDSAVRVFAGEADKLQPWTQDDDWHEVRLLAKRMRYAADTCATVLGDEAKATAVQAAKYQELLGQHQDQCAAADALTGLVATAEPELAFTLGRLVERHRAARKPLREEFLGLYHRS
ncbi:CHAD domain-containing protein [Kribbella antibiotica]|uniref:CHAD domain-containing protein n=1 Tax=Kribbella antibiotica TaxID=190195 RepID=A0A4R4ZEY1_9ACTN|nr:CHAD domain-containing protein [Kribbella antibiotica]TDD57083.1 CHAD domain-containing protein [Kribbella antibiotica]